MRKLEDFGVELRPLTPDDLDMLGTQRSAPESRPPGVVRDPVTDDELRGWSRSIERDGDYAWLVLWRETPIGLTRLTGHDPARKTGEGDILLWANGRDRGAAQRIAIVGSDWCFDELGLETITSTVAKTDRRAVDFNRALGHVFDPEVADRPTLTSRLTREAWERRRPELVREISILGGLGIDLCRLRRDDLELVRRWRNDPEIRRYMAFRDHITEEMQRRWFDSIDNESNHYSLVLWRGTPLGLSHVKDCDYVRKTGEGGLFLSREFRNSLFALRVAIVGTDWCFDELGLETITGTVLKSNRRATRFNGALGHVFDPETPGSDVRTCRLTREAYARARPRLVTLVR